MALKEPIHVARYSGYKGIAVRISLSYHLTGYILLPRENPYWGKAASSLTDLHVHGGVTFSDLVLYDDKVKWAVGFDCAHYSDYVPGYRLGDPKNYKNLAYVRGQLSTLAYQLRKAQRDRQHGML